MTFESVVIASNGREKNFVNCPNCEQKLLNVASLKGETEVVVKCRRCHNFVKIRLIP